MVVGLATPLGLLASRRRPVVGGAADHDRGDAGSGSANHDHRGPPITSELTSAPDHPRRFQLFRPAYPSGQAGIRQSRRIVYSRSGMDGATGQHAAAPVVAPDSHHEYGLDEGLLWQSSDQSGLGRVSGAGVIMTAGRWAAMRPVVRGGGRTLAAIPTGGAPAAIGRIRAAACDDRSAGLIPAGRRVTACAEEGRRSSAADNREQPRPPSWGQQFAGLRSPGFRRLGRCPSG
jgi:hypothetical protein